VPWPATSATRRSTIQSHRSTPKKLPFWVSWVMKSKDSAHHAVGERVQNSAQSPKDRLHFEKALNSLVCAPLAQMDRAQDLLSCAVWRFRIVGEEAAGRHLLGRSHVFYDWICGCCLFLLLLEVVFTAFQVSKL
jgi:hypothetical protein